MKLNHTTYLIWLSILLLLLALSSSYYDLALVDFLNGPDTQFDFVVKCISDTSAWITVSFAVLIYLMGLFSGNLLYTQCGFCSALTISVTAILTYSLKELCERVRPNVAYPDIVFQKELLSGWSFPSGHSSGVYAMAFLVSLMFPKRAVVLTVFLYAAIVSYSRVYLGIHYLSDVLAGAVLGSVVSFVLFKLLKAVNWRLKLSRLIIRQASFIG